MQEALSKLPDLTPSRKQPCVSGHPTHNPGIFVMYLSVYDAPAPWAIFRTREWHADELRLLQVAKFDIPQVEGTKNFLPTEDIQRRARYCLDDFTQQDEPYVAISHHRPWMGSKGFSVHCGICCTAPVKWR